MSSKILEIRHYLFTK